jgi:hypothetical protein
MIHPLPNLTIGVTLMMPLQPSAHGIHRTLVRARGRLRFRCFRAILRRHGCWVRFRAATGYFNRPLKPLHKNCGAASFVGYFEPHDGLTVLPVPWNAAYKSAYQTFLMAFASRYLPNPLRLDGRRGSDGRLDRNDFSQ